MKQNTRALSIPAAKGADDEKMHQIVDEVDRFFKAVHADIEDWKFSMEDYGDGPRIFVRFQIHVNKSGVPLKRLATSVKPPASAPVDERAGPGPVLAAGPSVVPIGA